MIIGCIADTHLEYGPLPRGVLDAFRGVDLILHAGDILDMGVVGQLGLVAETVAVKGNMDRGEAAATLPDRRVIEAERFRIGLTHGHGAPPGITRKVAKVFEGENCDCIVFGHTHNALIKERDGILFFNPGSPTDRMFARRNTVGLLEVTDTLKPRIIEVRRGRTGF